MERKIIIASHGKMAKGMADSISLITGNNQLNINTYSLEPGESADDFRIKIEAYIKSHPQNEVLVFTDVKGASVANSLVQLSVFDHVHVFTGTNLAMLLMICVQYQQSLTEQDISELIEQSRAGIQELKLQDKLNVDNEF